MILADTSFFSLVFRRRAPSAESKRAVLVYQELVRRNVTIGLPGIVAQEALAGLRTEAEFRRMLEVLEGFAISPLHMRSTSRPRGSSTNAQRKALLPRQLIA